MFQVWYEQFSNATQCKTSMIAPPIVCLTWQSDRKYNYAANNSGGNHLHFHLQGTEACLWKATGAMACDLWHLYCTSLYANVHRYITVEMYTWYAWYMYLFASINDYHMMIVDKHWICSAINCTVLFVYDVPLGACNLVFLIMHVLNIYLYVFVCMCGYSQNVLER